ncbi:hypothetical protein ABFY59_00280 [Priestia aryabhattai]|uniref:HNH endonuclease n=1 Tax=Priestia aryabhattai TaxID=412384 RepID=UPI003D2DC2D9
MIKIPENKYLSVQELHVEHLKQPVQDAIQFYLNCCNIISGNLNTNQLNQNIKKTFKKMTIKSFLANISTKKYDELDIQEVFRNQSFKAEFLNYYSHITDLLTDMLDPESIIYFEHILGKKPEFLISVHDYLFSNYSMLKTDEEKQVFEPNITNKGTVFKLIESIYDYNNFRDGKLVSGWGAYNLCEELEINVCPYCNRIYTFTVVNLKREITRPELDHYFPRSKFPIFAISFYNLIPSCKVCNSSIKKDEYLKIDEYLHPYINSLSPLYHFDFISLDVEATKGENKNNKIFINKNGFVDTKSDNFLNKFLIEDIYDRHKNIVPTFAKKHTRYPDSALNELSKLLDVPKEELLLILYNPPEEADIVNTSLGKLQRDLYLKFRSFYDV